MLEQEAKRLKVTWQKAQNYYNTFSNDFVRIKNEFKANDYEMTFPAWLFDHAGLIESRVVAELAAHEKALSVEERSVIVTENLQREAQLKAERNAALEKRNKEAAETKRIQAEAKAARERERADREAVAVAKRAAALAEQQRKDAEAKAATKRDNAAKRREENRNAPSEVSVDDIKIVNGEPCVPDLKVARALGYSEPRKIRGLIKRNEKELMQYRNVPAHGGPALSEPDTKFWLNEAQTILVCMFSNTPRAMKVREEIIRVFQAYRNEHLSATPIINEVIGKTNVVSIKSALEKN